MLISISNGFKSLLLIGLVVTTTSFAPNIVPIAGSRQRPRTEHSIELRLTPADSVILQDLSTAYLSLLKDHLYPTQSLTGGIFSFIGDAVAQRVSQNDNLDRKETYDFKRGAVYFCKGLGGGIIWTIWYGGVDPLANQLTDGLLIGQSASPSVVQAMRTAISILLEQFLACPIIYSFWDIPLPALLRGSPPRQIPAQIQDKLPPLLVANAKVWTPVNIITYNIPTEYRVLFISFADIFWQSINAFITSGEIQVVDVGAGVVAPAATLQQNSAKNEVAPAQLSVK